MSQPSIRELSLDDAKIMVAKRITNAMASLVNNEASSHDDTMRLQGLGFALGIIFEEFTGHSAKSRRPSELMKWAIELPEPLIRRVS